MCVNDETINSIIVYNFWRIKKLIKLSASLLIRFLLTDNENYKTFRTKRICDSMQNRLINELFTKYELNLHEK